MFRAKLSHYVCALASCTWVRLKGIYELCMRSIWKTFKHLNLISTKYQLLAEIYVIPFVRRQVFEQSQGMIVYNLSKIKILIVPRVGFIDGECTNKVEIRVFDGYGGTCPRNGVGVKARASDQFRLGSSPNVVKFFIGVLSFSDTPFFLSPTTNIPNSNSIWKLSPRDTWRASVVVSLPK